MNSEIGGTTPPARFRESKGGKVIPVEREWKGGLWASEKARELMNGERVGEQHGRAGL